MTDLKIPKNPKTFICENCDYNTSNKKDFDKHLRTDKHFRLMNTDTKSQKSLKQYTCECGKAYKHSQSLFNHRKRCKVSLQNEEEYKKSEVESFLKDETEQETETETEQEIKYNKIIMELIMQNKELQNTIKDIIPKIGNTNNTNTNNNTNNINIKIDNITLLNDKCKDALSMTEFINSIDVSVKHLLFTAQQGLVDGVSKLFLEQLKSLPLIKRPIWCSDLKRKKLFIKEGEWSEDINQKKTKDAIKTLTSIQARSSGKYTRENPDWMEHDKKKETFVHIVKETTKDIDEPKQIHIINNLLDAIHLTSNCKEALTAAE